MQNDIPLIRARLNALGIAFREIAHEPAYTMADCAAVDRQLGALTVKNIFLTTKNGKRFYLCVTRPEARFRTADISRQIGSSRLSFAPEEKLEALLHCRAGSASPLGLMFESAAEVGFAYDSALRDVETLAFHPCDNSMTFSMSAHDFFEVYLPSTGRQAVPVEIHDFQDEET